MLKRIPSLQKLRTLHNAEEVIHSFKKYGFTEAQIADIVRRRPQLFGCADSALESKIKLLEDFGFVDQNLFRLLRINPSILTLRLENGLLPKMEFLKNTFQSQDVLVKALIKAPRLLSFSLEETLKPSLAFWEGWGFFGTGLLGFLRLYPAVLSRKSLTPAQMDLIHKIGTCKERKMFKYVVGLVATSAPKTLEAKIENLKLCGLSAEETWQLLGTVPLLLCYSKENVSEKMNFLVNDMKLPASYVVKHANLLRINLEKTTRPRCLVWQKIKSISDLDLTLLTVLSMPEARFVSKIIEGHPESKTLRTIYENALSNVSNRTKS
ncbi:transcription termination factor MTEF1, chloroplastic [Cryptomeria japonica]|uniref:transcription termination factor MTEF1, chloroplastic n=1 Tax=Cryptomeria japonica TaxID=3369 RepID=UPI0027DA19FC|nr:transcription termination factor MTEF1, chloroplastic [Cryptomeria japonica]